MARFKMDVSSTTFPYDEQGLISQLDLYNFYVIFQLVVKAFADELQKCSDLLEGDKVLYLLT